MPCNGCAKRQSHIGTAVRAVRSGNFQTAAQNIQYVGQSLAQDAISAAQSVRKTIFGKPKLL